MDYLGKKVVIVGGSSGIGRAAAKFLAENNAEVIIGGRSKEKLEAAKAEIGNNVTAHVLDATVEEEAQRFFDTIADIDYLITTVGTSIKGDFSAINSAKAKQVFDSKYWGQFNLVKHGSKKVKKDGSIILFAGAYSQKPIKGSSIMTSINSAIEGLSKVLAIELAPIRVNSISPGFIDTEAHSYMEDEAKAKLFKSLEESLLLKRVGQTGNIVQAVDFLLKNEYTTGTTLYVDGGFSLMGL